jgi:alpha-1,6-mannosyltransferase
VLAGLKPDLIEAGDPYHFSWTALKISEEMGVPAVAFYHSDLPELAMRAFGQGGRRAAMAYARSLYPRFDAVFAPSLHAVERLESFGVKHALHQPLGVDTDIFHPSRRDPRWREELGLPLAPQRRASGQRSPAPKIAIYVGRFAMEKNLEVLTEAVRRLGSEVVLVAIGGGPLVPTGANVRVLPFESNPYTLARAIASADVFVHAGDQETFGLAALEALACGTPVIACNSGGLGELVDDTVGYSVPHCNSDEFSGALRALFRRDPVALGIAARERAERYDWSITLPGMTAQYRKLLGVSNKADLGESYLAYAPSKAA